MAAENGTLTAIGKSGRTYTVDFYCPDATGTLVTFNASGLAGSASPSTWRTPEDVVINDVSIATGTTCVGATLTINQALANGGAIRWANQLNTLANRQKLALGVRAGDFIGFTTF